MVKVAHFLLMSMFCIPAAWAGGDLSQDLKSGELWNMPAKEFIAKYIQGERGDWVDQQKTTIRLPKPQLAIGDIKMGETLVSVNPKGGVEQIQVMIYNKGDNRQIDKDQFEDLMDKSVVAMNEIAGVESEEYKPSRKESAVKIHGAKWIWDGGAAVIEASSSGKTRDFEAEFIRLKLGKDEKSLERAKSGNSVKKNDLKSHVKKEGKRVVIEGIPMVDQGQKGYCVVATAARIFSYYGMDYIDQHELASVADTSAGGGTTVESMVEGLKKIGARFKIRVREIDMISNLRDYQRLIKDYNRAARKLDKSQLDLAGPNVIQIWDKGDGEVLKAARCSSASQMERWLKPIKQYIDSGIPVCWSLQLGLVPEPTQISQTRGGHMRLIIGYDLEKKVILFSDSWGSEHSCKEMPIADAAAVTISRVVVMPSR